MGGALDGTQNNAQQQPDNQQYELNNHNMATTTTTISNTNNTSNTTATATNLGPHPLLHGESNRHCARCNTELGRITNRGAPCRVCKLRVCKACREFTSRTTDWVCVVCHKQMELQATSSSGGGEWIKDYTSGSSGAVDHLPTTDVLRRSIRRSWTISNPEDDTNNQNPQNPVGDNLYPQQKNLIDSQSAGSYPSLIRQPSQQQRPHHAAYQSGSASGISGVGITHPPQAPNEYLVNSQRRVLRQSTLPSSLPNNDPNLSGSGANLANYNYVNLTAPTSPHQMQRSPIYPSAYNSDDVIHMSAPECDNYTQQQQQQQPMNIQQPQQQQQQQQQPQPQSVINPQSHHRLQVRRQSTLPANPCQPPMYLSTSPNRPYSRSPERSPGEQRYPPFMRQTSFPCNMSEPPTQQHQVHLNLGTTPSNQAYPRKLLPTSPNYQGSIMYQPTQQPQPQPQPMQVNYDPQTGQTQPADELDYTQVGPKPRMLRQATLPNPDQHVKLLPTSPPKRQTSPQYRRSPEFMRQQTLPNPEAFTGNSLSVPSGQQPAKFMPLSPRHKQNFLFPNVQNPRQFLSQQHVPAVGAGSGEVNTSANSTGEHYSSSQSVNIQSRDHAKMMKVRSHSNEEYSITKPHHAENRRLLPEIPVNRSSSRSPSRLVRQECVKDDRGNAQDPSGRTFGEAKQQFNPFSNLTEDADNRPEYMDYFGDSTNSFLEADEVQYEKNYNAGFSSEPRIIYNDGSDDGSYTQYSQRPIVHSAENVLMHDQNYSYYGPDGGLSGQPLSTPALSASGGALPRTPQMHNRLRRRQSRELEMQQEELAHLNRQTAGTVTTVETKATSGIGAVNGTVIAANGEAHESKERRKPEQMRSISEDSGAKTSPLKNVPRRSLSHPEKETQASKKVEPTKIPSPRPLADILDKTRNNTKIPTPRRRNSRGTNGADAEDGTTNKPYTNERRNSDLSLKSAHANKKHEQQQEQTNNINEQKTQLTHTKENGNNRKSPLQQKDLLNESNKNNNSNSNNNNNSGIDQTKNADEKEKEKKSTINNDTEMEESKNKDADAKVDGKATTMTKQHTTTLGEQEIQNAVEAAAVIFKKVVLQRRQEKKAAEEEEAKAAAEESTQSPVIGKRNESTASPIQSRGSGTSETWPAQSDEDIDRLVAMHQNRDSLSSLGLRSDSMASVYSGAGEGRYGTVVVKGQVEFGIQYNYKLGALEIHVVRCKDLAAVDAKRNRSDPYVKVYLLPDKSKAGKRKTKVKKHTLNPIFDEILRFHMPISSLESRTLWLTVWHSDMFGRNDFLGEVSVNLQGKVFDNPQSQWYLLQERSEPFDEIATYRGDIVVGLKYIPPENVRPGFMRSASTSSGSSNLRKFGSIKSVASRTDRSSKGGQLHVLVKEAKHLSPIKVNGTCDAFCKSYLLPDRTRSSKQKTPVVKRSLHPTWNYTFIYEDVSLDDLSERALELTVWDHDRLASNEFLGGVRFSMGTGKSYGRPVEWMDATGKELSLWQNMIDRPNFWVEGSLILRSTLDGIRAIP
ncbi:uncharacterized protein LOC101458910 isoform X6 [Ceratitis capitata]|uniref:uncharacterized protein LOC101458910 isoform X6 n=1 Tax=Ceratitis capitata TaxID=7213 RepID=UPI000A1174BB|nr:uncharacterized protein LOC101458910 isoform X6 [Ceratitis capitata]